MAIYLSSLLILVVAAGCLGQDAAPKHFQPVGNYPARQYQRVTPFCMNI
jgi:hypothetical protein